MFVTMIFNGNIVAIASLVQSDGTFASADKRNSSSSNAEKNHSNSGKNKATKDTANKDDDEEGDFTSDWQQGIDLSKEVITVSSVEELTMVLSALAGSPSEATAVNDRQTDDDDDEEDATPGNARRAGRTRRAAARIGSPGEADRAAADGRVMLFGTPRANTVIEFDQSFYDSFNSSGATYPLSALQAVDSVTLVGTVSGGELITNNYAHFTIPNSNAGTYIFKDLVLSGGPDASSKTGGGIRGGNSAIELEGVTFKNLNSDAVSGHTNLKVTNCVFIDIANGRAINQGGKVEIDNSYFENINTVGDHGSAIRMGNTLIITNSSMINCGGGYNWNGYTIGAIGAIGSGKELEVRNCYFADNKSNMYGAAIGLYQYGGTAKITDSYFVNNSVSHNSTNQNQKIKADGGAVGIFNNGQAVTMEIDGCTFEGNTAMDDAGALFAESNTINQQQVTVIVKNSTFSGNESHRADTGDGGAVQLSLNVFAEFTNNTFTNNVCRNPNTNAMGNGAAIGAHFGRISGLNFGRPTLSCKNNLFAGNIGSSTQTTGNRRVNISGTMNITDLGGNIGYDYSANSPADLTIDSVYGVPSIALAENGSSIAAGCDFTLDGTAYNEKYTIPTLWIAPALTDDTGTVIQQGIHADDYVAPTQREYNKDQRNKPRDTVGTSDAGAVEMQSAKFDANLGSWATGSTYTYTEPLLYVKKLPADTEYSYVYSAVDQSVNKVEVPANPERPTYMFMGWTLTKDGTDYVTAPEDFTPGRTYYAKWRQAPTIDLTYHMNDGSGTLVVDPDGKYDENEVVTVKNYTGFSWNPPANSYFKGWTEAPSPNETDTRYQSGNNFTVTSLNNNLFAQWQEHYRLSYEPGAASSEVTVMPVNPSDKIDKGAAVTIDSTVPVRPGYRFEGWKSNISGDSAVYQANGAFVMPGQDVVMTAQWSQQSARLNLTYHMNDGSSVTMLDPDGSYPANTSVPVKSLEDLAWSAPANSYFKGWTTVPNPSDTDTRYQKDDLLVLSDKSGHLYAEWSRKYTVWFEPNGGSTVDPYYNVDHGSTIERPSVSRTGYTFLGWFTDDGTFRNQWNFTSDQVVSDMTLYASWRYNGGGNNGNGGGGGSGGGGSRPRPTTPDPAETLPDPEIPLGEVGPGISDGQPIQPLPTLPKTGEGVGKRTLYMLMILSAAGLAVAGILARRRKKEEQED